MILDHVPCALQVPKNDSETFLNFSAQIGVDWFGDWYGSGPVPVTVLKIQKSSLNTGIPVLSKVNRLRDRYGPRPLPVTDPLLTLTGLVTGKIPYWFQ